ncbi:MAG: twin-arginine translocase TatA/TatE family subunit [Pseudonocardiaceae bacterium]
MNIPGGWELVLILGVLVLLFGATKLPTAARSIGQSMRIFKAEMGAKDKPTAPTAQQPSLPPSGPAADGSSETGAYEPRAGEPPVDKPEEAQRRNDTIR